MTKKHAVELGKFLPEIVVKHLYLQGQIPKDDGIKLIFWVCSKARLSNHIGSVDYLTLSLPNEGRSSLTITSKITHLICDESACEVQTEVYKKRVPKKDLELFLKVKI